MPPIRSSISKRRARVVSKILLLSKIIPTYSRCAEKKLVYVAIVSAAKKLDNKLSFTLDELRCTREVAQRAEEARINASA